jgi:hypothetical protein
MEPSKQQSYPKTLEELVYAVLSQLDVSSVIFVDVDLSRLPAREGFCSLDKEEIFASIVNVTG